MNLRNLPTSISAAAAITILTLNVPASYGQVTGSGTTDYVPLWSNSTTLENSVIYQVGDFVGIDTKTPGAKLGVGGNINMSGSLLVNGLEILQGGAPARATGNTVVGLYADPNFNAGIYNTAVGFGALAGLSSASNNIGVGQNAGAVLVDGSNNIYIGSPGVNTTENNLIRIGIPGTQTAFFVAGVSGTTTGANDAVPVVIDSNGQLGTVSSSLRFKEDIQDMGAASNDLMRLRPVTFRYKQPFEDGSKPIQYGLVAEEVAEVYPDLVARSADGQIQTVKYQVLDSMLLNELQRQQDQIRGLEQQLSEQHDRMAKVEAALAAISGSGHQR
jgi:hypothetical protein